MAIKNKILLRRQVGINGETCYIIESTVSGGELFHVVYDPKSSITCQTSRTLYTVMIVDANENLIIAHYFKSFNDASITAYTIMNHYIQGLGRNIGLTPDRPDDSPEESPLIDTEELERSHLPGAFFYSVVAFLLCYIYLLPGEISSWNTLIPPLVYSYVPFMIVFLIVDYLPDSLYRKVWN